MKQKTNTQYFCNNIKKICSIILQFFFSMNTLFSLLCGVKLPIFPHSLLNITNYKSKILYAAYAICCNLFFWDEPPFDFDVKLPLFPNFQLNTSYCRGKSLYAAFLQLYAANMLQFFFLDERLF